MLKLEHLFDFMEENFDYLLVVDSGERVIRASGQLVDDGFAGEPAIEGKSLEELLTGSSLKMVRSSMGEAKGRQRGIAVLSMKEDEAATIPLKAGHLDSERGDVFLLFGNRLAGLTGLLPNFLNWAPRGNTLAGNLAGGDAANAIATLAQITGVRDIGLLGGSPGRQFVNELDPGAVGAPSLYRQPGSGVRSPRRGGIGARPAAMDEMVPRPRAVGLAAQLPEGLQGLAMAGLLNPAQAPGGRTLGSVFARDLPEIQTRAADLFSPLLYTG